MGEFPANNQNRLRNIAGRGSDFGFNFPVLSSWAANQAVRAARGFSERGIYSASRPALANAAVRSPQLYLHAKHDFCAGVERRYLLHEKRCWGGRERPRRDAAEYMQSISRHFARPQDGGGEGAVGVAAKRRKRRKEKCSTEQQRQFLVRWKTESVCVRFTTWRLLHSRNAMLTGDT